MERSSLPELVRRNLKYFESRNQRGIALFESLQAEQKAKRLILDGDPIKITLLDGTGTVKEGKKHLSTPFDIANQIPGYAAISLVSRVNGVLWDMMRPLEDDCELELYSFHTDEGRDIFWHSSAHILAEAIEMDHGCKLCSGSCTIGGEGFYYDALFGDLGLKEDYLKVINYRALRIVAKKQPFEHIEVTRDQALEMFSDNKFKVEVIKDFPEENTITVYRCGPLLDLCRGSLVPNTSFMKGFACLETSPVYWRGDKDRESLKRVRGISFPSKLLLNEYLHMLEESRLYDHRELGCNKKLFFMDPHSPGRCVFLPLGVRICSKLIEFIQNGYRKRGYQEVLIPDFFSMQLFETSGLAAKYWENMNTFLSEIQMQEFGIKPVSCAGNCLIYNHRVRSFRELPLRLADFGGLHKNEASGALTALTSDKKFQQDDAHIYCRQSQIEDEVRYALDFIISTYKVLGFTYDLKLSTRPGNYLGDLETWDKAEGALKKVLYEDGQAWMIKKGGGAFYGPKIDIFVEDALKRNFHCATLQLNLQVPLILESSHSAEEEKADKERPVLIHTTMILGGSVQRMATILLEHYKGKWPFWLSPRQIIVCSVSEEKSYALQVQNRIHEAGFYVDIDTSDRGIEEKVLEARTAEYNYILVAGEEEVKNGQVIVHSRDRESVKSIDDLLSFFEEEAADFH